MRNFKNFLGATALALVLTFIATCHNLNMGQSGALPFPLYQETGVQDAFIWYGVGVRQFISAWLTPEQPTPTYHTELHLPSFFPCLVFY